LKLIGSRYSTFLVDIDDQRCLVKTMDLDVPDRRPVQCHRELLGYLLATRLGLAVPPTSLLEHPVWKRVSVQRWIEDARPLTLEERQTLRLEPTGLRILLLDLLIANRDRSVANLLTARGVVFPIDFNVAFAFGVESARLDEPNSMIMRWLDIGGVLALRHDHLAALLVEIDRALHLVSMEFVHYAVGQLPEAFLAPGERQQLIAGLRTRRSALATWIQTFWRETVAPLHHLEASP